MAIGSESAPAEFAEAARTTFIYAPIVSVVGAVFVGIGALTQSSFPAVLGGLAYVVAVGVGVSGISSMIRAGQDLLARHHQASKLAIRYYERATTVAATVSSQAESKVTSAGGPLTSTQTASSGSEPSEGAESQSADPLSTNVGQKVSTDPAAFVALLKSLYILDATRDVQRLYGNYVCATFVNRKCEENGVPGVSLEGADIPAKF